MGFVLLAGCSTKDKTADQQTVYPPIAVERLDRVAAQFGGLDDEAADSVYAADKALLDAYMTTVGMRPDSIGAVRALRLWSTTLPVAMFAPPADSVFPVGTPLDSILGNIVGGAREHGIPLPDRRYAAVVWGRPESILFDGDVMLIALNHYLGEHHEAYSRWAEYRRSLKRPDMLPYDIAEALVATQMPYQPAADGDKVYARMLYEGALAEAKMQLIKDAKLQNALGFTDKQLADLQTNEAYIWNHLVNDKLLYSSDAEVMHRLFDLLPYSSVISPQAPGRAIRYTGWRIVRAYLDKHPDTTLPELLTPTFYNNADVLRQAGYAPKQ